MKQYGVHMSICLSVLAGPTAANPLLWALLKHEISIDCCCSGMLWANAGSVVLLSYVGS